MLRGRKIESAMKVGAVLDAHNPRADFQYRIRVTKVADNGDGTYDISVDLLTKI